MSGQLSGVRKTREGRAVYKRSTNILVVVKIISLGCYPKQDSLPLPGHSHPHSLIWDCADAPVHHTYSALGRNPEYLEKTRTDVGRRVCGTPQTVVLARNLFFFLSNIIMK